MGKKAKSKEDNHSEVQGPETVMHRTASLPGTIRASTSGLLQSSFRRPSPGSVTNSLASLNADACKVASASSSANPGEASSSSQASTVCGDDAILERSLAGESFRSERAISTQEGQVEFDEFMARSQGLEPDSESMGYDLPAMRELAARSLKDDEYDNPFPFQVEANSQSVINPEDETLIQNSDGAAVVALLSKPDFTIETEADDSDDLLALEYGSGRNEELLGNQRQDKSTDPLAPMNPLDLMPDFGTSWEPVHPSNYFHGDSFSDAKFDDIQPWANILNRYHDEVWGDMLPLVKEAREEVKAAKASPDGALQERPAIRRLGMLLKHLEYPMG